MAADIEQLARCRVFALEIARGDRLPNAANYDQKVLMWQTLIHITFLLSALAIALTDRLMSKPGGKH